MVRISNLGHHASMCLRLMDTLPKALLIISFFFYIIVIIILFINNPRVSTRKREHDSFYSPRQENMRIFKKTLFIYLLPQAQT